MALSCIIDSLFSGRALSSLRFPEEITLLFSKLRVCVCEVNCAGNKDGGV